MGRKRHKWLTAEDAEFFADPAWRRARKKQKKAKKRQQRIQLASFVLGGAALGVGGVAGAALSVGVSTAQVLAEKRAQQKALAEQKRAARAAQAEASPMPWETLVGGSSVLGGGAVAGGASSVLGGAAGTGAANQMVLPGIIGAVGGIAGEIIRARNERKIAAKHAKFAREQAAAAAAAAAQALLGQQGAQDARMPAGGGFTLGGISPLILVLIAVAAFFLLRK